LEAAEPEEIAGVILAAALLRAKPMPLMAASEDSVASFSANNKMAES